MLDARGFRKLCISQICRPLAHWRKLFLVSIVASTLSACAHDVVLKPAASSFAADTTLAMTSVSQRYDGVISDLNEQNVRFLVDNPACGLNTTVRLRTPAADALLARLMPPDGAARDTNDACLTTAEWEKIDDYLDINHGIAPDDIAPARELILLSRTDFDLQLAAVKTITDYVKILADAADESDATVANEIDGVANGLLAIGAGTGKLQQAMSNGKSKSISDLFGADGPAARFARHLSELGAAIEVIADEAKDVKTLRQAILGPTGDTIPELLDGLASDADDWSCIRFTARLGQNAADALRLSGQLPTLSREQRAAIVRTYLQNEAAVPDGQCGSARGAVRASPLGQMLGALKDAHLDLERIARGDLRPAERRREAGATMDRLGAVFKAIGGAALVIL